MLNFLIKTLTNIQRQRKFRFGLVRGWGQELLSNLLSDYIEKGSKFNRFLRPLKFSFTKNSSNCDTPELVELKLNIKNKYVIDAIDKKLEDSSLNLEYTNKEWHRANLKIKKIKEIHKNTKHPDNSFFSEKSIRILYFKFNLFFKIICNLNSFFRLYRLRVDLKLLRMSLRQAKLIKNKIFLKENIKSIRSKKNY